MNDRRFLTACNQWLLFTCAILLFHTNLFSQCALSVDAGPDQIECEIPATFQLSGSVDASSLSYIWSPTTGLSDPNSLTPSATVSVATTYTLTAKVIDYSQDLIENGDFSNGNTSFSTDYTYNVTPSLAGNELVEGQYSIGTNPAPMHVNWVNCGDHTTGTGNMMLVNGSETAGQNAWCQTINIMPNTEYAFSVWVTSVDPNGPCEIQFNINGNPVGAGNVGLSSTCDWINFFEFWDSGAATTAEICIEDINIAEFGNDFAIDDIVFAPTCIETDEVTLTPIEVVATADSESELCEGETLTLTATGGITYDWYGPIGFIGSGSPTTLNNLIEFDEGTYTVIVTDADGCTGEATTEVIIHETAVVTIDQYTCDTNQEDVIVEYHITQYGCDSIVTTNIILAPSHDIEIISNTCDTALAGLFVENLSNQYGCDSTVTTTIELNPTDYFYITETVCDSAAIDTITQYLFNQFGCDSTVVIEKIFNQADSTFLQDYTCELSIAGMSQDTLTNINGCDSIVFIEVIHIPADSTYIQDFTCDMTATGTFENPLFNVYGCDSIIFTEVILIPSDSTYIQDFTCDMTATGTFENLIFNANGCDSIIFTEVILIPADSTYIQDFTCDMAATGMFENPLFNADGCDSIIFTEVILIASDSTFFQNLTCDPETVGVDIQNLINQNGCDSTVTTSIILSPRDTTYIIFESCDSLDVGISSEIQTNQFGCDSTIITEIEYFSDLQLALIVSQPDCFITNQGSIGGLATGGEMPYLYSINDSAFEQNSQFDNLSSGIYDLTVQDANGCFTTESIIINAISAVSVELGQNLTITLGDDATIQSMINIPYDSLSSIVWTPLDDPDCATCLEQNVNPILTTTYSISVTDVNGCESNDALTISVEVDQSVYIPNIISANGDGINDKFTIYATEGAIENITSFIGYDRWGNNIWQYENIQPNDTQYGWDGTFKGSDVNSGVYVWIANIEFTDGSTVVLTGDVTVVR